MSDHISHTAITHHQQGPPPRGPSLLVLISCVVIALVALVAGVAIGPSVKSWADARRAAEVADKGASGTWYISQMHPWIIQPEPGQCPICGMDLTPVDPDRFAGEITIDPVIVQNMGVRIAEATRGDVQRDIRTVGTVSIDESRVTDVVPRFGGWIEEVHVGARWDTVARGDPLFRIYAPQVLTAEQEWLIADSAPVSAHQMSLLNAAERKLELLALPAAELIRLQREGKARDTVTVTAPGSGVVWMKNVHQGTQILPNTVAYRLVDLGRVWVEATLYERHLPFVTPGLQARIRLDYGVQQELDGRIDTIYPAVDPQTREIRVRFVFDNQNGPQGPVLKPGMFATVFMPATLATQVVTVPVEAVIGTGARKVVFVSLGRGKFEPRDVTLGGQGSDGRVAILDGIQPGEQVVVSGQFLLDSESKMREALAKVMKGDLASNQEPAPVQTAGELTTLSAPVAATWAMLLRHYLDTQDLLYQERLADLPTKAVQLQEAVQAFIAAGKQADEHFHHQHPAIADLEAQSATLKADSLDAFRPGFGALSITLDGLLKTFGQPQGLDTAVVGMRCGMARGIPEKGLWLQRGQDVRNPYFGAASDMRSCAADTWALPKSGAPAADPATDDRATNLDAAVAPMAQPQTLPTATVDLTARQIDALVALQEALFAQDLAPIHAAGAHLKTALQELGPDWEATMQQAQAIRLAADLHAARVAFGKLMVAVRNAVRQGAEGWDGVKLYRCGMARGIAEKGLWLQKETGSVQNPYFGADHGMAECAMSAWHITAEGLVEAEVE